MATSTRTPLERAERATLRASHEAFTSHGRPAAPPAVARCPRCRATGRPGASTADAGTCASGAVWRRKALRREPPRAAELDHVAAALCFLLGPAADVPLDRMPPAELATMVRLRDRIDEALDAARAAGRS
ncbi:hypothetical protein [Sorangium sp. So ce1335]|uniref:hypothetical protein n=1 Tax=Sorangium sp. So ce1335 TaxID=3133335 RepID=UPI003F635F91